MREVAVVFGLGASARPLLETFAAELDEIAFLARWRELGFASEVNSWLGDGPNEPVSPEAFEEVFGSNNIQDIADRLGLNARTCTEALAFATPAIINPSLEADRTPTASASVKSQVGLTALASLAAIVFTTAWFSARGPAKPAEAPMARVGSASVERPTGLAPSTFSVNLARSGELQYTATLRDQGEKKKLETALAGLEASGTIEVDLGVNRAPWLDSVRELIRDMPTGAEIAISNDLVVVSGFDQAATDILRDRVNGLTIRDAGAGASGRENALASTSFDSMQFPSISDWLDATKLMVLNFPSGGTRLSEGGQAILKSAAKALMRSKTDAIIQIAGYTDSSGSDAGNRRLSQRRADAVLDALVEAGVPRSRLSAVGFGPDDPIADNDTADGRAKNRRIEFRLAD